jgi:hypothetical protein
VVGGREDQPLSVRPGKLHHRAARSRPCGPGRGEPAVIDGGAEGRRLRRRRIGRAGLSLAVGGKVICAPSCIFP